MFKGTTCSRSLSESALTATFLLVALLVPSSLWGQSHARFTVTEHRLQMNVGLESSAWHSIHKNELRAVSRVTLHHNAERPVHEIPVLLNRLLEIRRVGDQEGRSLAFRQRIEGVAGWKQKQINVAAILLPEPLDSESEITLEIEYAGSLAPYTEAGQIFVQERLDPKFTMIRSESYGYPHIEWNTPGDPPEPFDQHLEITVPEGYVAASGHRLADRRANGEGKVTWVYDSDERMFQIVIPIARYRVEKGDGFEVFYFPEDEQGARRISAGIEASMNLLASWFGPLHKRANFSVAEIPEGYGSQALRPTVIQTAGAFNDPKSMVELYHEIAHFWDVELLDVPHPRWNEGLAMLLQALVAERLDQSRTFSQQMEESFSYSVEYLRDKPEYREIAMQDYGKRGAAGVLPYTAGAVFFGALWEMVGHEQFARVMAEYRQRYGESGATTAQFIDHWNERTGGRTTRLFEEWFTGSGYADLMLAAADFSEIVSRYQE